ncbi:UDP-N-acetylglucosamine--N-acetylmuramyl-(pentapeptide) pyrophosphoryl-undecaprenol N-acetylglucosamine transferase [Demequina capsici]|uniref:UDP-N-acetylglucosamine--N-acetylmuramyl-(pentapeptide) pyrophosphoryl-undecaprenol N-acetylglucosamine transferase n=1 Tax=Demequina capsici TaxID=3075620 RepID=A0AA96FAL2_9MICO|nr:UDP-N-acetylglucosamine--N-acetylmuramyl-(pentapeptide) pyrophosphoryl-undecaprenol N-acetylglucosamine transferase [Demequina sp. PMTSA13]WNM26224.1 UDP-N-acetylglucosamine--N-acetylmuramyl-(pentapeptide) pyrophosphoryl-undecaprenol N-acetylglucosamine transferase [Demequina sp. PMTSA13]
MGEPILLAGGGTAGHVNPLLATAAELQARGHAPAALGTAQGLEVDLVPRAGLELFTVPKVPMPRRPSMDLLRLPVNLKRAVDAAGDAIDAIGAKAVVGFGGYASTPAYLAARRRKVPVIVHEGNMRPGLANRLGARWAVAVAATFSGTPLKGAVVTGLPLRAQIADLATSLNDDGARDELQSLARMNLGWPADAPVLLVTGGSSGAASLNAATAGAAARLTSHGVHVIHLTGKGKADEALRAQGDLPAVHRQMYLVQEYAHDMAAMLGAAGAVVARSGAGMVCELTALGIPALYVPLPHGNGEQGLNAGPAVSAGAATMIRDADLNPASIEMAAERMLLDREAPARMRAAAQRVGIADGSARLADLVEEQL